MVTWAMNKTRWLTLLLLISLGINLLLAGTYAGWVMSKEKMLHIPPEFGWMMKEMKSEATREEIHPLLTTHIKQIRPIRREIGIAQRNFNKLLVEPKLDEEAMAESLRRLRDSSSQYQVEMHKMMLQILSSLTVEERNKISHYLKKHSKEKRRSGKGRENRQEHPEKRQSGNDVKIPSSE